MFKVGRSSQALRNVGAIIIGGDFQGLGILRSLSQQNVPTCLLDSQICIGRFSRYREKFFKCPSVKDGEAFLDFLENLVEKESLRGWVVFPTDDETVYFLSNHKSFLEEHLCIPTPPWGATKYLYDKRLTYQLADDLGIPIPKTWYPRSLEEVLGLEIAFPAIIKPAIKDRFYPEIRSKAVLVNSKAELIDAYERANLIINSSEIMIQDVIPGGPDNLFSFCSLFKNGKVLARLVARRARQHPMDFGHASTFVETVDIPELEVIGKKFLEATGYYGLSEVEFKRDPRDGRFKLLEVNARTWGWHTLGLIAGVNFPYLLFQDLIGQSTSANSYEKDVKWARIITDFPTAMKEIFRGRMKLRGYLKSLKGKKELAVFSWRDPLPFLVELALLPYLWKKKGF